jgi:predicted nucleic-acid-binding Zn-ribbon protein
MRSSGACPKCSCRELYVVSPLREQRVGTYDALPVPVVSVNVNGHEETLSAGTHELWICSDCGFEERYAVGANAMLETLAKIPETGVRKIGAPKHGYR